MLQVKKVPTMMNHDPERKTSTKPLNIRPYCQRGLGEGGPKIGPGFHVHGVSWSYGALTVSHRLVINNHSYLPFIIGHSAPGAQSSSVCIVGRGLPCGTRPFAKLEWLFFWSERVFKSMLGMKERKCCSMIYILIYMFKYIRYIYIWSPPPHDPPTSILYGNYQCFMHIFVYQKNDILMFLFLLLTT